MGFKEESKPTNYLYPYSTERGNVFEMEDLGTHLPINFFRYDGRIRDTFSSGTIAAGRLPEGNRPTGVKWETYPSGTGSWNVASGGGAEWSPSPSGQHGHLTCILPNEVTAINGNSRSLNVTFTITSGRFFFNPHFIGYNPFSPDPKMIKAEVGQALRWNATNGTTIVTAGTHTIRAEITNWSGSTSFDADIYLDGVLEISGTYTGVSGGSTSFTVDGSATGVKILEFSIDEAAAFAPTSWECRNASGQVLASGTPVDETAIEIAVADLEQYPDSGPCGWYHLLTYGPDRADGNRGWADAYGDTVFTIVKRNTEAFPSKPSVAESVSSSQEWDEPTHGYMGMGPIRYAITPSTSAATLLAMVQKADAWCRQKGTAARPQSTIVLFQGGAAGNFSTVTTLVDATKDYVDAWEAYNEPNLDTQAKATTFVANHMEPFYNAVKAADPSAIVLGPSIVQAYPAYLQYFINAGGHNFCDGIAIHVYNQFRDNFGRGRRNLEALVAVMAVNSITLPLWQTEQGAFSEWHGLCTGIEAAQTNSIQVFMQELYGLPIHRNVCWYDRKHGFDGYPANQLSAYLSAPQTGAVALRTIAAELYDTTMTARFDFVDANDLYAGGVFERSDGSLRVGVIAQGDQLDPVRIAVTGAGSTVVAVDPWGNESSVSVVDGVVTIPMHDRMVSWVRLPSGATASLADGWAWGADVCAALNGSRLTAVSGTTWASRITDEVYSVIGEKMPGSAEFDDPAYNDTNSFPQTFTVMLNQPWAVTAVVARMRHAIDVDIEVTEDGSTWVPKLSSIYTRGAIRYVGSNRCLYTRYLRPNDIHFWKPEDPLAIRGVRVIVNDSMWAERYLPMFDLKAHADEIFDLDTAGGGWTMSQMTEICHISAYAVGGNKRSILLAR